MSRYLLFLSLLLPVLLSAQVVEVGHATGHTYINNQLQWIEDTTASLRIEEVFNNYADCLKKKKTQRTEYFNRRNYPVFGMGFLHNTTNAATHLIIDNANIDSIDLWYTFNGKTEQMRAGQFVSNSNAYARSTKFIFRIPHDGRVQKFLIRARNRRTLILPVYVTPATGLHGFLIKATGPDLLMLGMVAMLFLHNLFMYTQTRSRTQRTYLLYLFSLVVYAFLYIRGFRVFLPDQLNYLVHRLGFSSGAFCHFFAMQFAWQYLDRESVNKRFVQVFRICLYLPLLVVALDVAGYTNEPFWLIVILAFLTPAMLLSFGILSYRRGDKSTLFFLLGWACVSSCVIINTLLLLGIIPASLSFIPQGLLAGTCIEMLLLSAGIGYRFSLLQKEKLQLKEQLVDTLSGQKRELEDKVAQRTAELKHSLMRMEESNAVKARLLSIISHDLKMPFVSLNAALDLLSLNILSPMQAQQKLANIKSSIRNISGTLENLLTWSKMQLQGIETRQEPLLLQELCAEAAAMLHTSMDSKGIKLWIDLPPDQWVEADQQQLLAVIRNLLSNAINASPAGSTVRISGRLAPEGGQVVLSIEDNGAGIKEPELAQWLQNQFQPGDVVALSNGLGLQICREFLSNHNTHLHYVYTDGTSVFSFKLPVPTQLPDAPDYTFLNAV